MPVHSGLRWRCFHRIRILTRMLKDNFVRVCLAAIVLLLGIIAYRISPPQVVKAANTSSCLIEDARQQGIRDAKLTSYCQEKMSQGWRLHSLVLGVTGSAWIWEK
jgi:hypothetical protein